LQHILLIKAETARKIGNSGAKKRIGETGLKKSVFLFYCIEQAKLITHMLAPFDISFLFTSHPYTPPSPAYRVPVTIS
jgi:hypothetical protein